MELTALDFFGKMRQYDFAIAGKALEVYEFEAKENVFENFSLDVTIVSGNSLELNDYVGKEALFTMIGRKKDRYFHGIVSTFTWEEPRGRYYIYRATVVPMFWKLNLTSDVRVFQNKTTKEIVKEVLEEAGILSNMVDFRDHGKYSPREYCVQFRETNMAFISRLLAEEGMFYYFEFTKESHLLVIGDMHACHKYITGSKEVKFSTPGQLTDQVEHVTKFDYSRNVTTGKVSLKDYHFDKPSYAPTAEKNCEQYDDLELYDYPGYLSDADTELRLAEVALERATLNQSVATGKSICRRFTAGHIFILKDHQNKEFNDEFLITEITHKGKQPQALKELADQGEGNTYGNDFKCISGNTSFRPEKPIKPSVMGVQTAIVTGPPGEEIHVDEFGRIKVQFYWDRIGAKNEKTTCWLRVSQPWAGSGWGTVFIPRIGQEVVVSFIDGDPDRPIVTGALYNGANTLPYAMPDEKTKSTIKTRSTKGGGGFNELRFEDKKGSEEIYIHGEKDWNIEIKNDKGQHVGHDETLAVDNDRSKTVGNDQNESIGNNKDITVAKNHTESVGENYSVTIGKNLDESTGDSKTVSVGKNIKETIGENSDLYVTNNERIEIGKNHTENIGSDNIVDIGKNSNTSITENLTLSVGKHLSANVTQTIHAEAGEKILIVSNNSDITLKTSGATLTITNSGDVNIKGANVNIDASGKINMNGTAVNQN